VTPPASDASVGVSHRRAAVKKHGTNEMAIQATAADEVDNVVTEHLLNIVGRRACR
jgi:hypothetical protein